MAHETETTSSQETELLESILVLARNIRVIVIAPIATGLAVFGMTFLITPSYVAITRILPPPQQTTPTTLLASQIGQLAGVAAPTLGIKNPADLYVGMIKSRTVADKLLARFELRELYKEKYNDDARKELARRTKVTAGKDGLIVIEVEDYDAKRASELANSYVDALRELTQTLAVTEAAQRRLFFERQLKQARDELTRSEIALSGSGISEAALKTVPQSVLEAVARLKAQITAQEIRLGAMRGFMTNTNPEYKQAQQELNALRIQLAKAEQVDIRKGNKGEEYLAKFRDFKYHETLFDLLAKQYEMARLDESREGAVIQIVDAAVPPERNAKPRRVLIAVLGACGALLVTGFGVFFREWLRRLERAPLGAEKVWQLRRVFKQSTNTS